MSQPSIAGSPILRAIARTMTISVPMARPAMRADDDARCGQRCVAANDNEPVLRAAKVDAALTRLAEAIGRQIAREHIRADRKSGVSGKSVSVRVDPGGRRVIKKKKKKNN